VTTKVCHVHYRVRNNVIEVFWVGKWRAMRYVPHNSKARTSIEQGHKVYDELVRKLKVNTLNIDMPNKDVVFRFVRKEEPVDTRQQDKC